jgi:hypothetical protein
MDAIKRVANFLLASRGNAYCNDCLAANFTLNHGREARQVTDALADSASFQRSFGTCSACGRERIVIGSTGLVAGE